MLLFPYGLFAQPLSEGTSIEAMQFKDQFEKNLAITAQTQQLIVVFSKVEGEKVKAFLEANPNYLREKNALYLMDVTPVPGMVMSMFMLPITPLKNKLKNQLAYRTFGCLKKLATF
jgi:hypothetical protein